MTWPFASLRRCEWALWGHGQGEYVLSIHRSPSGGLNGHCRTHAQHNLHGKGGKNPTFSSPCIGFLILMQLSQFMRKQPWFYSNIWHLSLDNQHHHLRTLGPLPYNINLSVINPNTNWILLDLKWLDIFMKKTTWCQPWCKGSISSQLPGEAGR